MVSLNLDNMRLHPMCSTQVKWCRPPGYSVAANSYAYNVEVSAIRPAADDRVRIIPCHDDVAVALEEAHNLWRR